MRSLFRAWATRETAISELRRAPALLIAGLLIAGACTDLSDYDSEQIRSSLNDSLITTTESWDVEMVLMRHGRAQIFIEGTYALSYQSKDRKETHIRGPVYVQLFDTTGAVETEAWSKRAIYHEQRSEFELYDSVSVLTHNDRELYTEYLVWSQETDRISSPRFVTIITPSDSISGRGFEGLTDLSSYTIDEPRGRLIVD
jgi:LPS export ABC transporter protein LptC